jgi:hypothetical protein
MLKAVAWSVMDVEGVNKWEQKTGCSSGSFTQQPTKENNQ